MVDTQKMFCYDCHILQTPIDVNGQLVCHVCKKSLHDDSDGHNRNLDEQETDDES